MKPGWHLVQGPYTVTIQVPYGTLVSNVTGGTVGSPAVGANNTVSIPFTANTPLLPGGGNSTFINMSVLASSQVGPPPHHVEFGSQVLPGVQMPS